MILTSLQKLSSNVGDLAKLIVAISFEWLPKVQKIAQSGHTGCGSVGRAVASDARGPKFESSLLIFLTFKVVAI